MVEYGNTVGTGAIDGAKAAGGRPIRLMTALRAAACVLAGALVAAFGFVDLAHANDGAVVHVSYQWYASNRDVTEDYEVFDVEAQMEDGKLVACVMPEAYGLADGCAWRVMKNFAGGIPAGEKEITGEAGYDEATGVLTLPASRAGEDLTIVFQLPWDHESHSAHGRFRGTPHQARGASAAKLSAQNAGSIGAASFEGLVAGTTYPLSITSGANGLESSPAIYGADSNVTGAGTVMGYPEFDGRYKFYVNFDLENCELFQILGEVPGRQGNGGTIYGGTGTPYDYSWAADYKWCAADCVENVYNTGGMPVPLGGDGSWVRIDSVSGSTLSCTFRIECNNPDGSNAQDIMGTFELTMPKGALAFQKGSANHSITDGNACYTQEGAVYGVFGTEEGARTLDESDLIARYTTDENGAWETGDEYDPGTYYIRELEAPEGYALSDEVIAATVDAGAVTGSSAADEPLYGPATIQVQKRDHAGGGVSALGNGTLAGAEITFRYYDGYYTSANLPGSPTRTWVMKTGADGIASPLQGADAKVAGDGFYRTADQEAVVPLGTLTAIETKAPEGYLLGEPTLFVIHIAADPSSHEVVATTVEPAGAPRTESNMPVIDETEKRGNIALVKVDEETGKRTPQGDANLAGTRFDIVNRSGAPVISPETNEAVGVGEVVCTIVADETGYAATDNAAANGWSIPARFDGKALAFGTYEVVESAPGAGYLLDESFSAMAEINTDAQVISITASDPVVRGGVAVGKVSRENGAYLEQGRASLSEWTFEVVNRSARAVVVDGAQRQPGEVVAVISTREQDGRFIAATDGRALPCGTYEVREVQTMRPQDNGYLFDAASQAWSATFAIAEDGAIADFTDPDAACANQVVRGDFAFMKTESPSMERLAGIPFKVTSATTGEWHVLVTDGNGAASTEAADFAHSAMTNANDQAIGDDGAVDETKLNPEAGIWFDGRVDAPTEPDDAKGALPFDTYIVEELPVQANRGLNLVSFEVTVSRDGKTIELGTLYDEKGVEPQIATSLKDIDGGKLVAAKPNATLVDTVRYNNLDTTASYVLVSDVYLVDGGAVGEQVASSQLAFTPATTHGEVDVILGGIDTSGLAGCSLVCFERLYDEAGKELARHEDPADEGQTVGIPSLATTLADTATGTDSTSFETPGAFTLTDTVMYQGLVPHKTYLLTGTLHDRETGGAVLDSNGIPVSARSSFVPDEPDGSVPVTFAYAAPADGNAHVVAFESLSQAGVEYAVHADLANEDQTIAVPRIATAFADGATGEQVVPCEGEVELADVVTYENLVPGRTYTALATLYDKETGAAVTQAPVREGSGTDAAADEGSGADGAAGEGSGADSAAGKPVTSSVAFTPTTPSGTVTVPFRVDAASLPACIVCFERVRDESGRIVAVHEDIEDAGQTVVMAQIGTTLVDGGSGTHAACEASSYELVDTVAYAGLVPGKAYAVEGSLHFQDTGEPVADDGGREVVARAEFTPERAEGTVDVTFSFRSPALAGRGVVAFESVSADGRTYAVHADRDDGDQTVYVPAIATELVDSTTNRHVASATGPYRLVDAVAYEALEPGGTYTVVGTLMDKATGKPAESDGKAVEARVDFTPATPSGTVSVAFNLDEGVQGASYVAFERVYRADRLVAAHEDIDSESQTVRIATPPATEATPPVVETREPDSPRPAPAVGTAFDKTGYWLLQHWPLACAVAAAIALAGGIMRGRRRSWHHVRKARGAHAARR